MRRKIRNQSALAFLMIVLLMGACRRDSHVWEEGSGGYPTEVAKIIQTKCASPGCHTNESRESAAGLSLETWEELFKGTVNGSAVIPFSPGQSTMFLFTNTFPDLGVSVRPTMPVNEDSLSREEVLTLMNWIKKGAPDQSGKIMFADHPFRSKYYVVNQGCDLVTSFDPDSKLPMRYIKVGHLPNIIESPHQLRVSPDGKYWYVIFLTGNYFQKYSTTTDSLIAEVNVGTGQWNTFQITNDGKYAFAIDYSSAETNTVGEGIVACIDLQTMKIVKKYCCGLFNFPHAVALYPNNQQLLVFNQEGSQYYMIDFNNTNGNSIASPGFSLPINMDGANGRILKPHDVVFNSSGTEYYVTCQATNEVRIFDAQNHKLLSIVPTGAFPQELALSAKDNLLFVTCMEDKSTFPGKKGSVAVIDLTSRTLKTSIYTGHQPHGIAVDESRNLVIVANRNASTDGPAPHHSTECGGRNGSVSFIDLKKLEFIRGSSVEVSVDPYFVSIKP